MTHEAQEMSGNVIPMRPGARAHSANATRHGISSLNTCLPSRVHTTLVLIRLRCYDGSCQRFACKSRRVSSSHGRGPSGATECRLLVAPCPVPAWVRLGPEARDSPRGTCTHTHTYTHHRQRSGDTEVGGGETEQIDRQTRRDADRERTRRLAFCLEICANIFKAASFCSAQ